jgi:hypothetical protein
MPRGGIRMLRRIGGPPRGSKFLGGVGRVGLVALELRISTRMTMSLTVRAGGVPA